MKLCKNYVEGMSCPLNENCPNDHIDIRNLVRCEIDAQLKGNQWPLSCFGPFINKPSIPNYIEDLSFEEIRMMYYDSNTSFIQNAQKLAKVMKDADNKMQILMSMNIDVLEKLTDIYNYTVSTKETKKLQDLPTLQSPFGNSKETNVIGTPVIPLFGKSTTGSQPEINTTGTVFPLVPGKVSNVVQQSLFAEPQQPEKDTSTDLNAQNPKEILSPFGKTTTGSRPESNTNCLGLKPKSSVFQQWLFAKPQQPEKDTSTVLDAQNQKLLCLFTNTGSQPGNDTEPDKLSNVVQQPLFASAGFEAQTQTAQPIFSAFKPLFTVSPPNKPLQLGFSSAPQLKFDVFGQLQKQEDQGLGTFGIPNQQKEPNFKITSSVRPQEQKEQSWAQHIQPKTGLISFIGPSPRTQPLFDISKTQQKKNGFGVLGTKKPLEQSEHRFGFFNIAEPEKRQQPETNLSVFGVPKAQEQNKYSFGFFTSPEQEKQKNEENTFGFLKPSTIESSVVPKPAQLTYPSLFGFSTPQQKQNQEIGHSTDSEVPPTELVASRKYEDIIAHFDTLLRESIKRITASDCVKLSNAKLDNLGNKTTPIPNVPLLIIKPKAKQTSEQTQTEVQDKIDPVELSAQIDTISKSFEGSIVIKCSNEESIITLSNEVNKMCGANYDVEVLHHEKDPQIVVHEIDNQIYDYKLVEIIMKQNKLNGKMNFVKSFEKMANASKHSAVIEVDKNLYKEIMKKNEPSLYIGWNKCFVQDNFNISRCFNCWGFNHSTKTCSNSDKLVGGVQLSCTKYVPSM